MASTITNTEINTLNSTLNTIGGLILAANS
jgi:hypothetical protein